MDLKQKLAEIALDRMVAENERLGLYGYNVYTSPERVDELKECVHEFFTKYLNYVEESDSGRLFNPVTIGCCRALMLGPLNELLERMRVLSGADRNPLSTDGIDGAKVGEVGVWGEKAEPTWHCPLKKPDCKENCGSYGCGN